MAKNQAQTSDYEFSVDTDETTEKVTNSIPQDGQALTFEDFEGRGFNSGTIVEDLKKLTPPAGDWEKEDTWTAKISVNDNDCMPGDYDPRGRTYATFYGRPKERTTKDHGTHCPFFSMKISPDRRFSQNNPENVDNARKLFAKAWELYIAEYGEEPEDIKVLAAFIAHGEFTVRTSNFDNGPFIIDLKAKRQKR